MFAGEVAATATADNGSVEQSDPAMCRTQIEMSAQLLGTEGTSLH